ncbi:hypothetical protein CKAH01_19044 [Colletotrichum kahawae]|uniref:Uncharacterized protein n=1 Tax=Colletotrichum kahawae TaxID=34407 RepID=A0AAD9Y0J5_COLKA|nr:hypothetical protein CKAH01_19044 [Colletotrichum kahawae]
MSSKSAVITTCIHKGTQADALVDTGCDLDALIDHDLAYKLRLLVVDRSERLLGSFSNATGATKATGVVVLTSSYVVMMRRSLHIPYVALVMTYS